MIPSIQFPSRCRESLIWLSPLGGGSVLLAGELSTRRRNQRSRLRRQSQQPTNTVGSLWCLSGSAPSEFNRLLRTKCCLFSGVSVASLSARVAPSAAVLRNNPQPGFGVPSWTSFSRNMDTSWFRPPRYDPGETLACCLSTPA